jgi:uncharacterized protein YndB with AHSA1/START domain
MAAETKRQNVVVSRVIDAPVEQVWKAWVDPELVKRWWGPDGFTAPLARMDFREGGTSLVSMVSPEFPEHYSTWHYREIVPHERIAYIHNLADPEGNTIDPTSIGMPPDFPQDLLNVVVFRDLGDGRTELTVTEYGWTPDQMMELSRLGLEQCLAKMAAIFA